MRHRIERPTQRQGIRIPLELELRHSQGVLCPRGALQFRHLAEEIRHREQIRGNNPVVFTPLPARQSQRALPMPDAQ